MISHVRHPHPQGVLPSWPSLGAPPPPPPPSAAANGRTGPEQVVASPAGQPLQGEVRQVHGHRAGHPGRRVLRPGLPLRLHSPVRRAKDARQVRPIHPHRRKQPPAPWLRPGDHRNVPDVRVLRREGPQDRSRHSGMRRVPQRVQRRRNAAFDPQVQPRVPRRLRRRLARQPLHLPRLPRQPLPHTRRKQHLLCRRPDPRP